MLNDTCNTKFNIGPTEHQQLALTEPAPSRWRGEHRLAAAVLLEAIDCLRGKATISGSGSNHSREIRQRQHERRRATLASEAQEWIESDDTSYTFTFMSVCDVLNLEPNAVRRALLKGAPNA